MSSSSAGLLESAAINLSLWLGGVGLTGLKGIAYMVAGSALLRASMFDSLGDVLSSAIMAVTQMKKNDTRDADNYPVGKARFGPLGVLFFCAFMTSTMSSMVLDSLQTLFSNEEEADGLNGEESLRRLFDENPRLLRGYLPWARPSVDEMVEKYAAGAVEEAPSEYYLAIALMGACCLTKVVLYIYCRYVTTRFKSETVEPLRDDHFNDAITNGLCVSTLLLTQYLEGAGIGDSWRDKMDPAIAVLLSSYIAYNWVTNAIEKIKVLCDERVDDDEEQAIRLAAQDALRGSSLQLTDADVYTVGEGCRVSLELVPTSESSPSRPVAELLENLEAAVRRANESVQEVDTHVRLGPRSTPRSTPRGGAEVDASWVKGYAAP